MPATGPKLRWTETDRRALAAALGAGEPLAAVAERLGRSREACRKLAERLGLERRRGRRPRKPFFPPGFRYEDDPRALAARPARRWLRAPAWVPTQSVFADVAEPDA